MSSRPPAWPRSSRPPGRDSAAFRSRLEERSGPSNGKAGPDLLPSPVVGERPGVRGPAEQATRVILSFDVEEHDRIEAAAGLTLDPAARAYYRGRVGPATRWLLDELGRQDIRATFFV